MDTDKSKNNNTDKQVLRENNLCESVCISGKKFYKNRIFGVKNGDFLTRRRGGRGKK